MLGNFMSQKITIIDYGMGNLLSVQRGIEYCGASVEMTSDPERVFQADKLVLPGVGAFGDAIREIRRLGLDQAILDAIRKGAPMMGICLGMQLMFEKSDEFGVHAGLAIFKGEIVPIPRQSKSGLPVKIPHIGWSSLLPNPNVNHRVKSALLSNLRESESVYFVHSFMAVPAESTIRLADCEYGGHQITAMVGKEHVFGCQFHPEKSGRGGLSILSNFVRL